MENAQLVKGTYGYIQCWKQKKLIAIGVWAVFIAGMIGIPALVFHSRYNAFTIAGIVMVLPAARQIVQYIAMSGFSTGNREEYEAVESRVEGKEWLILLSDMVLSSETGHMVLNMIIVCNGNIYGYAPKQKKDREAIEAYLANVLSEEDSHKRPVVHEDFREFEEMAIMLAANEPSQPMEGHCIAERLKALCL
ncbi:MAG: hypothetical protein EOM34_09465 [Clostridia bacterium]|nr:hypothetical protein [Lachnospiraceae bacterium]NCC00892.1 hypothetical protein [Clostridia bacterium]NCD03709.1 hypothetical protein [Clostridia bacterium]